MKKSLEERIRPRLMNIGKRNKVLRVLIIPVLFLLMSFFHVCTYLHNNGKRLAMLAMSCLLFTVFSSFSFPAFIMGQDVGSYSLDVEGAPNVSLAQETELNIDDVEILVDDEVLADSDYSGTSHGYAMIDRYDAAEILESIGDRSESGSAQSEEDSLTLQNSEVNNVAEPEKMPEFLADDWRLVLINQQNSIPEDYSFTLGTIKNKLQCDERIIDDLRDMLQKAKEEGISLEICSPYRDMNRQEYLFNRKINLYMNRGFSYMEAYQLASEYVMVPGASEHQLGLALDIVCVEYTSLDDGFAETDAAKWLKEHSCEYGFILRYPLGKEYITGVEFEPWHFRYVGVEAATVIMDQEITLEEFWEDYVN